MSTVLIVDARSDVRQSTAELLRHEGYLVREASGMDGAASPLKFSQVDVVLCGADGECENDGGLELVSRIKAEWPHVPVILFTRCGSVGDRARAIKAGASDCVEIPADRFYLARAVRAAATARHGLAPRAGRNHVRRGMPGHDFVAVDSKTLQLCAKIEQAAAVDSAVLITGESGTGKELIARSIFEASSRRQGRLVPLNCGAIPETLIASELFGHRRGAFTGAISDRKGLIEEADGSVLFLDEIGDMPAPLQVHLLRFLDSGEIRRIGESAVRHVNVRVIAATNRPLYDDIETGRFRLDLFYRLSVLLLDVPPLRERRADIPALAEHYLRRITARLQRDVRAFSSDATRVLETYDWPGNVRELQNAVESAVIQAAGDTIQQADLPSALTLNESPFSRRRGLRVLSGEKGLELTAALERTGGNYTRAAAALGISRTTLWRRLKRVGVMT